ncbi:MAG TPA: hypothetical protein VMW52_12715 [Phycisphaerae bacterium]|nr:hypothetical protein [Phycisphaerae bacterium]
MTAGPNGLVNRAAARRYALDYAERISRGRQITAVGADVYPDLEAAVRKRIRQLVDRHPGAYRTLKP